MRQMLHYAWHRRALTYVVVVIGFASVSHAWCALLLPESTIGTGPMRTVPVHVQHYNSALKALAKNDLNGADASFREAAKQEPKFAHALLGIAHVALQRNQPKEAEAWLMKAEQVAPKAADVQTSLGRFYFAQHQFDQAEAAYRRAIALDAKAFPPRIDLADLYLNNLRRPGEASNLYRAAVEVRPDHAGAHYGLGVALINYGKEEEGIVALEKASALAPKNPLPLQALSRLHLARKQYDRAVDALNRLLAIQPDSMAARVDRGDAYAAKGDTARAVADYEAALDKNSRYAPAYLKLGMLYQGQQRWREAESAYLKCVEADPSNVVAYNNLAWMAADQKRRPDDALAWARKAVELAPKSPAVRDTLAWVHRNRGELKEAQSVLEKAASMSPPHAGVQYRLGVVYSEQGRERDALAAFEKALDIEKSFPEAEEARRRIAALKKR